MYPEIGSGQSKSQAKLSYSAGYIQEDELNFSSILYNSPEDIRTLSVFSTSNDYLVWTAIAKESSGDVRLYIRMRDSSGLDFGSSVLTGFTNKSIPIKLAENNNVVSVVITEEITGNSECYLLDLKTVSPPSFIIQKVTDSDFPNNVVDQLYNDTYFLWLTQAENEEGRFYISGNSITIADIADVVNPLDFGTVEHSPDKCIGFDVVSGEIAIFGTDSIEYFYNSGNIDFPYSSNQGVTQDIGTNVSRSIRKVNNVIYFIGSDKNGANVVYEMNGYRPERISTHAIERRLNYLSEVDYEAYIRTECYSYQIDGHYFYCIKYQSTEDQDRYDSTVFVYDTLTRKWHENTYFNGGQFAIPIEDTVTYFGSTFGISSVDATSNIFDTAVINLYRFTKESLTIPLYSGGESVQEFRLPRIRTLPHLSNENKDIVYSIFELDVQKGLDDGSDPSEPDLTLYMSKDGGQTYGNGKDLNIGDVGDYMRRVRTRRLGRGRDVVFKIESKKKIKQEWFNAYLTYEMLND
jgi:hypothetical protein